jgi:hypothetical protein
MYLSAALDSLEAFSQEPGNVHGVMPTIAEMLLKSCLSGLHMEFTRIGSRILLCLHEDVHG